MTFIRKIKKTSGTYLAEVESYRIDGKVKQRVIKYLGKEIDGKAEKRVLASEIKVDNVKRSFDVLAIDTIARELGITSLANKGVSVRVLMALASHKNLSTTQRYIELNPSMMRSAVELMS